MSTPASAAPASPLRAVIVCPGRGSYGRADLGTLTRPRAGEPEAAARARAAAVAAIDAVRAARGEGPLAALDGADRFSPGLHLRSDNASDLVLACAAADLGWVEALEAAGRLEVVAVLGNSLGFYVALHAAGALDVASTARLVGATGALQVERGPVGGQVVYPVSDPETWAPLPEARASVERALAASGARLSIDLGGALVLAGSDDEVRALEGALPAIERGGQRYPLRLAGHSAFHTAHMRWMGEAARARLAELSPRAPRRPLLDGRGAVHRPLTTDPSALWSYTLGEQVTTPYDFARSVRVALRDYAPDVLVALGPGESLGAPLGQVIVAEGYAGVRSKAAFQERQLRPPGPGGPLLAALGRPSDRERWVPSAPG